MTQVQQLITAIEQATSPNTLVQAVWNLANAQDLAAIPTLIEVLGYNNPGAAVAAVEGLVKLGERAVPILLENIDGYDYGARAWANRALARIGDPRALEMLLEAASQDFALSVRRAAAKGLGGIQWEKLPPEEQQTAQERTLTTLAQILAKDEEWVVRYAAVVGLEGLGQQQGQFRERILEILRSHLSQESELAVRARIQWAQQKQPTLN
ncbi:HEAT repeat domain-containing protein [Spirulina subsalsa FACHB-351]|uniref:HEAT repeat domain-containing protein n=1 Tax=Spirulina subsalsa FACHB-351 TaxID=234711 RepID=A0ABT3L4K3_9CYAN|nr:HEAT repeat domain-containing protein [Spirulina subsalsa]MCW6036405.1 HEAT repeat domain-containing protein [Spirulina subsalsa FACHB-351]